MNKLVAFFLLILLCSFDKPKLVKTKLADNIYASIPSTFKKLSDEEALRKYYSYRIPVAVFTSEDEQADFTINYTGSKFSASDLEIMKDFYKSSLMSLYTNIEFSQELVKTVGDRKFIVFEFVSEVKAERNSINTQAPVKKYTWIQYTPHKEVLLVFTFSCPIFQKKDWQSAASQMMGSIKINKSKK